MVQMIRNTCGRIDWQTSKCHSEQLIHILYKIVNIITNNQLRFRRYRTFVDVLTVRQVDIQSLGSR